MKKLILVGLFYVSVCISPAFSQGNTINLPSAAHSPGATAGYFVDPDTGKKVYRLSDRSLCPGGGWHFYSYSNQFSIAGDIVLDCRGSNSSVVTFPVYDKNFKLLYKDAVAASNAPAQAYRMTQWSQSRRVLFAQQGTRIWEFDPFSGVARQIADFGGKTFTTSIGGTLTVGNIVALSVGPGDRLMVHVQPVGNYTVMAIGTFELATGRYSFLGVPVQGQFAPKGFDEATYSQNPNGRVTLQNSYASSYTYASNLSSPVKYDDNNGHRGFFCGSNGRCYKVNPKNDSLSNGQVGQLGCPGSSPWISEHALYNDQTGRRELVWSCDMPASSNLRKAMGHFSRSQAADVFFGSGSSAPTVDWIARYQVRYDGSGNPNGVSGNLVATARSNPQACGYWAQPRVTSDPTGTRALFDSTASNTTYISKENGTTKTSCLIDVYVAEYSTSTTTTTPPPPPSSGGSTSNSTISVSPSSLSFSTAVGTSPSSQTVQLTTSSSGQTWAASSNQSWLRLGMGNGTGSYNLNIWLSTNSLAAGSYSGVVTVSSGNSQATVNVTLTVGSGGGSSTSVSVNSLSLSPNPVVGAGSSTGTVRLSAAAPSGGAVVSLARSSSVVSIPGSVTVPAGQTAATFQASVAQVSQRTQVTVSANYNGSVQAILIADPPSSVLSVNPGSLSFVTKVGSSPSSQRVQITTASGSQTWTASSNQSWLRLGSGNGAGSYSLNVWLSTNNIGIGTYLGTITLNAGTSQVKVPVSLSVVP